MTLVGNPIPPAPAEFAPAGAPPGVTPDLAAYDYSWVANRPQITPRVLVIHTNGGSGEGSYGGAIGWSNGGNSRTHAHYNLNAPQPSKNLATDRRAIANSTPKHIEREYGEVDCSFWTIAIETADRGHLNGGGTDLGDFLYDHDELVARIIAYESIVWGFPIEIVKVWNGEGIATHTAPFDGVYTIYKGKSCPGTTKKQRVLDGDILPRAREIHAAWTGATPEPPPDPEEDEMTYIQRPPAARRDTDPWILCGPSGARAATDLDVTQHRDAGKIVDDDSPEADARFDKLLKSANLA